MAVNERLYRLVRRDENGASRASKGWTARACGASPAAAVVEPLASEPLKCWYINLGVKK